MRRALTLALLAAAPRITVACGPGLVSWACGGCREGGTPASVDDGRAGAAGLEAGGAGGGAPADSKPDEAAVDGAGLPPDKAWLTDPAIWTPLAGAEFTQPRCYVFEADGKSLKFPVLSWEPCGTGCALADVTQGYGTSAYLARASTVQLAGGDRALLTSQLGVVAGGTRYGVLREVRLDDGVTVAAAQRRMSVKEEWSYCSFGTLEESAKVVDLTGGGDPPNQVPGHEFHAMGPIVAGSLTWARPALPWKDEPYAKAGLDIDVGLGQYFALGGGAVWALLDPTSSKWTLIEAQSKALVGAGQGDLAVWTDYGAPGMPRIRGWAPPGGVRTIIEGLAEETCWVVATPTHLVGQMGVEKSWKCDKPWDVARVWKSPRAYVAADASVSAGPPLPGTPFFVSNFKAWGDFAALVIWPVAYTDDAGKQFMPSNDLHVLVVQLSTWKVWRIDAKPGYAIRDGAVTVTASHLYVGEALPSEPQPTSIQRMVRYDLSKVDDIGKRIP